MSEFKLNLTQRKNVKEGDALIEAKMVEVNKVWAQDTPLTWDSNIEANFRALSEAQKTDRLNDIGTYTANYVNQLFTVINEFFNNEENKAQLLKELTSSKVSIRIGTRVDGKEVAPWALEEGILYMQTEVGYWGSWISSIDAGKLASILGLGERMHLVASKSVTAVSASINKSMAAINTSLDGKKIHWIYNNIYEIYNDLKTIKKKSNSDLDSIGSSFEAYATQFKNFLPEFLKNEDNKEALLEELPNADWYLGVRVSKDKPKSDFLVENGCIWMVSEISYFGSWVSSFNGEALEKILTGDCTGGEVPTEYTGPQGPLGGIWSPVEKVVQAKVKEPVKMNLTQKKDVKAGDVIIAECMEKISKIMGEPFVWENNIEDVFRGLIEGKKNDLLDKAGTTVAQYAQQFVAVFTEFAKDEDNKAQLKKEVPENKLSFRIQEQEEDGPAVPEMVIDAGILYMVAPCQYYGSWISYKTSDKLCEILGSKDPMGLIARKNVRDNLVLVEKSMSEISKIVGKPAKWVCDAQDIFDRQISEYKAKRSDLDTKVGNGLKDYANQLLQVLTSFCENEDNKEALLDEFSGSEFVCGVRIVSDEEGKNYFAKQDGTLYMNVTSKYYGSWISSYTAAEFEKIF